jgi:Flp pilus assembly protein TadB
MLARLPGSQDAELGVLQQARPSPDKTKSIWALGQEIYSSPEAVQVRAKVAATALQPTTATDNQMMFRRLSELSADLLMAAFLKLNVTDPNNSVETHQDLHTAMSKLRERAIRDAQQKMKVAAKLRAEAEKEADKAGYVSTLMSVIRIVLCVVALICMCIPGLQGPALLIIMIVIALACCACTVVEAKANNDAANASIDAGQAGLMGKRAQMMAEQMQEQLEQEAEIMKMIIESKNKMVEAVIRMMNAAFGSAQKLMSAGMARG